MLAGARTRDHCNAHESTYWNEVRSKKSRKDLLKLEYDSSDSQLVPAWLKPGSTITLETARPKVRNGTPSGGIPGLWARHTSNTGMTNPQANRRSAAAALTPLGAAAAGTAGLAERRGSAITPATPAVFQPEAKQQTPEVPARPPASPWLEKMPTLQQYKVPLQLLATLELPIKTTKGLTIAELQHRLVPTGFYKSTRAPLEYGDNICLDNIAE